MISLGRGRQFVKHVLPAIIRPLRVLWNQVIGFFFLALAAWAMPAAIRSIREYDGDPESFFHVTLSGLFILMMAGFGVYSFRRANRAGKG